MLVHTRSEHHPWVVRPRTRLVRLSRTHEDAGTPRSATGLILVTIALFVAAIVTFWPFLAPLVLAAWAAHLAAPLYRRFRSLLGGRGGAAGIVTALLVITAITPLVLAVVTLVPAAKSLFEELRRSSGKGIFAALVSNGQLQGGPESLFSLARDYGAGASRAIAVALSASFAAILAAFVFFTIFYALLIDGDRWWQWARAHAPVEPPICDRFRDAFHEAGRGLLVGTGLTALVQGVLAAAIYGVFGVPRALLLGMLSVIGALIPVTGTAIVWVPVVLGLFVTGHPAKAAGVGILCTVVVGTVDNFLRPWLSGRFRVGMPMPAVLVAMFGGVIVFGGWGLFLGPLLVRLTGEALAVCRERRLVGAPTSSWGRLSRT